MSLAYGVTSSLRTAKITALLCALAAVPYAAAQVEPSPFVVLVSSTVPLITVILWLQHDAARTGVGAVHDLGLFLWIAWPVAIPWYAWKTRGRSGWRLGIGLFVLIGSSFLSWLLIAWLTYGARYLMWWFQSSP